MEIAETKVVNKVFHTKQKRLKLLTFKIHFSKSCFLSIYTKITYFINSVFQNLFLSDL